MNLLNSMVEHQGGDRLFNNPDSFAMTFDEAWKRKEKEKKSMEITLEEKVDMILSEVKDHPFMEKNPSEAKAIATFRIRLLNLN
tara:strand:- start:45 stop:296 length:252 start_codon:yes stop_codon:yes gene_type:complete